MSFLKKIGKIFSQSGEKAQRTYWLTVSCGRCSEIIRARLDLYNDLSPNYAEGGGLSYFCRKVLMGDGLCFQKVEVLLTFDPQRNLINREITGGEFVDPSDSC